ncbi:MAG: DUF3820 family protein [Bacteroidales bacterium]
MLELRPNNKLLLELLETRMPFGKFKGTFIIDLPEYYLLWFEQNGLPKGKLGDMLGLAYEIKLNGLEAMVKSIPIPKSN